MEDTGILAYGIISVIPPVLAIALALWTKNIIVSLFISIMVGMTVISGYNPMAGLVSMIKDYMFDSLAESSNAQALFMMVLIGGFVALLTNSGGAMAFTDRVTKFVNNRAKCEAGIWLGGLFVWFTDSGNSLIVGPIFEAVAERLRVSREKFSYILDCTTSPICALIPIIGWGVYAMGLIETELTAGGVTDLTSWDVFIETIPFNFYAILTLLMCGFMAISQWDYGPMLQAQNRSMETGKTLREGSTPVRKTKEILLPEGVEPKISTMAIPILVVLVVMFTNLGLNGFPFQTVPGTIIRTSIAAGFLTAMIVLIGICVIRKIMSFEECLNTIMGGMSNMMYMVVVLVLAWTLGGICKTMGTADFLVEVSRDFLNPALLPAILFIIGAVMSLATGTSWGTMAILMPIGLPMAISLGVPLPVLTGAIISGGLFGDHCSPISDTTILASMGAACDLIDHFRTQMPYAITCGAVCTVMFLFSGWYANPIMLPVAIAVLISVIFILHKISVKKHGHVKQVI